MALRIHFTADDLSRTRLAEGPRPLVELGMMTWAKGQPARARRLGSRRDEPFEPLSAPLLRLVGRHPWKGRLPAFVLSPVDCGHPREALERLRSTSHMQIRKHLADLTQQHWVLRHETGPEPLHQYFDMLVRIHDRDEGADWPRVDSLASADRALRIQHLATGGVESLLAGLDPLRIRWRPPVLEVDFHVELEVRLGGRGLLLVPTLYGDRPVVGVDPCSAQHWLTYPVRHGEHPTAAPRLPGAVPPPSLAALLGRTRAAVLCAIAAHPNSSTTQLAARTGIAPASASEHASVLRSAGLTAAVRHRNAMLHTPTSAGIGLLEAAAADDRFSRRPPPPQAPRPDRRGPGR
ncbi:winged helix-turn-helix domain-containing protein [Streptomyces sp. ET3-23]|uniref:ArsR/SmtB family transcription factor n=1 Tax=Streptomyces sp. ET3-23 TaxID=2885643 RepID=UPI001D112117|nr:winged helix-turn-helix domain-containing protein [Streptomyces sp. ET3-23]MCC2277281.1 winged helix-turn-helix domain-containing protein [Streptomyces sp. ET3-23]